MSEKTLLRLLGILMILNGVFSLTFGSSSVRFWRKLGGPIRALASPFLSWPDWLIRAVGTLEAVAGGRILEATQVQVTEFYGLVAPLYDPFMVLWYDTVARGTDKALDQAVREYLPPGGSVLDLGCGTGANVATLLRLGIPFSQYVGVDLTPEMLAVARRKFGHLPDVAFQQRDLLRDPLPEGEFDLIISTWLFSHLRGREADLAAKAQRHLKPDGHVVLLIYSRPDSWLNAIAKAFGGLIAARPVPPEVYMAFPGRVSLRHLMGGIATLVVLRKQA